MEGNRLLITQALDERALLIKKINSKIEKAEFVDLKRRNEERALGSRLTPEDFQRQVEGAYQQILALMDRYQRIDAAIIESNARTKIQTSYGELTVAAAISLRDRLRKQRNRISDTDFEGRLEERMEKLIQRGTVTAEGKNRDLEDTARNMRLSILGRENKNKEEKPLEVVETYVKENTMEVLDPLDLNRRIAALKEKKETLLMELETQLKISNATTYISV